MVCRRKQRDAHDSFVMGKMGWGGVEGARPPGQREWKQFRYVLLIIVSKEPGVARWMKA